MAYVLDRDGLFEVKPSLIDGGGHGVFCMQDVKAGTILPYTGVAFKESRAPDDMDRTYTIGGDFNNSRGKPRTSTIYSIDGNPHKEPIASLKEYKKAGCQINEASRGSTPNCMFCVNPFLDKGSFKESFVKQEPIVATYIVVVEDLPAGTELLTMYGDEYTGREYKPCKMKRKQHDRMVDAAYNFVDSLAESGRDSTRELLEVPEVPGSPDGEPIAAEPKRVRFQ